MQCHGTVSCTSYVLDSLISALHLSGGKWAVKLVSGRCLAASASITNGAAKGMDRQTDGLDEKCDVLL
jgi:hypothetical protein